jgi:hypothetical protein
MPTSLLLEPGPASFDTLLGAAVERGWSIRGAAREIGGIRLSV